MKSRSNASPESIIRNHRGRIFHFTFKGWPWGRLFLLLLIAGCQEAQPGDGPGHNLSRELDSLKPLLRSGDLVLRNGTDATSQATRRFNRKDTSFSHCGIIAVEEGRVWVYHAIGGSYNPSQQLKKELLDSFSDPADNDRIAVYRYPLSKEEQQRLINIVRQYYKNRLPFDLFFNFETDDRMYCSEFVFKSINKSMDGRLLPIAQQQPPVYISIDDLFLNPYATLIKKIEYPILASP